MLDKAVVDLSHWDEVDSFEDFLNLCVWNKNNGGMG
jgi:hypothetical protein